MSNTLANSTLESNKRGQALTSAELGMMVTLASFAMLFGTLFLSYLLARARFPVWPPIGTEPIPKLLPTLSTVVLLISSFFVHRAQTAFQNKSEIDFKKLWMAAQLFGFSFLAAQAWLWMQVGDLGIKADSHLFGSIFYTMIGLHAAHILGGLGILLFVGLKARNTAFFAPIAKTRTLSQAPRLAAWVWHFLDVMWIIMYLLLVWI